MSGLGKFVDQLKKDGISFQGLPIQQQQSSQAHVRFRSRIYLLIDCSFISFFLLFFVFPFFLFFFLFSTDD